MKFESRVETILFGILFVVLGTSMLYTTLTSGDIFVRGLLSDLFRITLDSNPYWVMLDVIVGIVIIIWGLVIMWKARSHEAWEKYLQEQEENSED